METTTGPPLTAAVSPALAHRAEILENPLQVSLPLFDLAHLQYSEERRGKNTLTSQSRGVCETHLNEKKYGTSLCMKSYE